MKFFEVAKILDSLPHSLDVDSPKRLTPDHYSKCDPRKLVRALGIPPDKKNVNLGPAPGGIFFALADANDLPPYVGPFVHADTNHLLKTGDLYLRNIKKGPWQKINNVNQIDFKRKILNDDSLDVKPFFPEFYYVPRNAAGRRTAKRARG